MRDLELVLNEIQDPIARENFDRLMRAARETAMSGFYGKFLEFTTAIAVTARAIPHGLAFIPKDVIQTSLTGAGAVTWLYATFDREFVYLTTTGACVVRAFVGTYQE